MDEVNVTTSDLLDAWREASRAADLADRLSRVASEAALEAEEHALASEEIATLAERVADAADQAAERARAAAVRARTAAHSRRQNHVASQTVITDAEAAEEAARDDYHQAEDEARRRYGSEVPANGAKRSV